MEDEKLDRDAANAERDALNAARDVANISRDAANVSRDSAHADRDAANVDRDEQGRTDRRERRKGVADVLRFARNVQVLLILQFVVIVVGAVVFTWSYYRTSSLAEKNELGIEVGCTLLRDAILSSGAASDPNAVKPSPQQELTAALVGHILRDMPASERREALRLQREVQKRGGVIVPDCRLIALHPETVLPEDRR